MIESGVVLVVHVEAQRHHRAAIDVASPGGGRRDRPRPHRPRRAYRRHLVHLDVESTAGAAGAFVVASCGTARPDDYFARLGDGLVDYLIAFGARCRYRGYLLLLLAKIYAGH